MPRFGAPGNQIGYRVYDGPPGAPPLFLIHGFTASSASFVTNIKPLSREFTVVTVDLLGHGDSDAPEATEPYGPGPAVDRIVGLIQHLGHERVMLCGHSLGGALALRVALDAPARVAALVVINSNSAAGTPEWRKQAAPGLVTLADRVREEGTGFMRRTRLYPAASSRLPDDARALLVRDFDQLAPHGVAGTAVALTVPVNAFERLSELSVPTLVVIGDRDQEFVRTSAEFLDRMPPELTSWVTIEDAGHAANLEQPAQFEEALVEYARDLGYLRAVAGAAPSSGSHRTNTLTVVGLALIAAGVIMVAGAFLVDGEDGAAIPVAPVFTDEADEPTATTTPTPVESSAGVRTPGPEIVTATPTQAAPSPPTADTPAPTATSPPAPTQPVVVQPTSTETPTEDPTEEPTPSPTPSGPFASIGGPATSPVGVSQTFVSASAPGALRVDWNGCSSGLNPNSCSQFFDSAGCHTITLVAYYANEPQPFVAVHNVAIGDGVCQ